MFAGKKDTPIEAKQGVWGEPSSEKDMRRRSDAYDANKEHPFFDDVDSTVARNMAYSIFDSIVEGAVKAAKTSESEFSEDQWGWVNRKFACKLMALRFCFDMLGAPVIKKEVVSDSEYDAFVALGAR